LAEHPHGSVQRYAVLPPHAALASESLSTVDAPETGCRHSTRTGTRDSAARPAAPL
jgi:hypothetical protein